MRRGEEAAIWEIGGAWQCAVRTPAEKSKPCEALNAGSTATKTSEKDRPCAEAGCRKGAYMDGIVLQHSSLCWWPGDEQGIESQHCIACSGVAMARQSKAYAARAIASTASRIGLVKRICNHVRRVLDRSQGRMEHSNFSSKRGEIFGGELGREG